MAISLPAETTTISDATAGSDRLLLWNPRAATCWALLLAWHIWGGRGQERYIAAITGGAYVRPPPGAPKSSARSAWSWRLSSRALPFR